MSSPEPTDLPDFTADGRPGLIRNVDAAPDDTWKRLRPAWIFSAALHVVMLLMALTLYVLYAPAREGKPLNLASRIQDEAPTDYDLVNPQVGIDPSLDNTQPPAFDPARIAGPELPADPLGLGGSDGPPVIAGPGDFNPAKTTAGGGGNGLSQRGSRDARSALVRLHGGNDASEAAVAKALAWLARQQKTDGRWVIADGSLRDDVAATAVALLPFLAAGETHMSGRRYRSNVLSGLTWMLGQQKQNGEVTGTTLYTHALATIAICEAYGMTQDAKLATKAQAAVNFVVNSQHPEGGWRYAIGQPGDTSVTGWMVQALKSGELAGLSVPRGALEKASKFLDRMAVDGGSRYGYLDRGSTRLSIDAVGLLTRQYLGWTPKSKPMQAGVEWLKKHPPQAKGWDIYYLYYATQVVHFYGGDDWSVFWNPKVRDLLVKRQDASDGPTGGSWPPDETETGRAGGRLVATALSALTLEVYYRHLPLYQSAGEALEGLD